MRAKPSKRVFIFGAGASVYAGFPTANRLWQFLLDHIGVNSNAMEWIDAHLAASPPEARENLTYDIERLLTGYQNREPNPITAWRENPRPQARLSREQQEEIKNSHRHYLANPKLWDFDG